MDWVPGPRLPVGSLSSRYSRNQNAIFAPLTMVSSPHHQARGPDRTRHSNRIDRSAHVIKLTLQCNDYVTNSYGVRESNVWRLAKVRGARLVKQIPSGE